MALRVRVEMYGRLRDAGLGESAELELAAGARAGDALTALGRLLGAQARRLEGAAIATESRVLGRDEVLPAGAVLAVLPPVSGG